MTSVEMYIVLYISTTTCKLQTKIIHFSLTGSKYVLQKAILQKRVYLKFRCCFKSFDFE